MWKERIFSTLGIKYVFSINYDKLKYLNILILYALILTHSRNTDKNRTRILSFMVWFFRISDNLVSCVNY